MAGDSVLSIEIVPNEMSNARIALFSRSIVGQMSLEINLGTPSIMLSCQDVEETRNSMIENGVTVGDIVEMGPDGRTFNFADPEGNYFAV